MLVVVILHPPPLVNMALCYPAFHSTDSLRAWRFPERKKEVYFEDATSEADASEEEEEDHCLSSQHTELPTSPLPSVPFIDEAIDADYQRQFFAQVATLCVSPMLQLNTYGSAVFLEIAQRSEPSATTLARQFCVYSNVQSFLLKHGKRRHHPFTMPLGACTFKLSLDVHRFFDKKEEEAISITIRILGRQLTLATPYAGL